MEQIHDQYFEPVPFTDALKSFESGQVYNVLSIDEQGKYSPLSKEKECTFAERVSKQLDNNEAEKKESAGYLIYIVTQEVIFDEEISTITYFKDITFGVMYEQIKAQT